MKGMLSLIGDILEHGSNNGTKVTGYFIDFFLGLSHHLVVFVDLNESLFDLLAGLHYNPVEFVCLSL